MAAICSLALFVALAPIQWGLVHEAIHGILAGPGPMNRLAGRVLSVLLGHSFEVVRFGHLMHHAHTGHDFDCPDRAPPDGGASAGRVMIRHYGHILGGQYVLTAVSAWAALLPWRATRRLIAAALAGDGPGAVPIREAALRRFGPARRRAAIRADVVAAFSLPALSGFLYGPAWPWLVSALYGRALLLSLMDNMPHYGVGGSNAAEIPIFRASGWLSLLVMNHHLHRIHHLQPALPWVELPVEFARQDGRYDTAYANGILRQFRGPTRA
ncbi:MAG: fatty acid desaturase [Alphaproteobacteria bacterium]|nr:fatty acid desaturase [Alphaproteobacteria bacterium]